MRNKNISTKVDVFINIKIEKIHGNKLHEMWRFSFFDISINEKFFTSITFDYLS